MKKPIPPILVRLFALFLFFTVASTTYLLLNNEPTQNKLGQLPIKNDADKPAEIYANERISPTIPHPEPEYKNPVKMIVNGEEYVTEFKDGVSVYKLMQDTTIDSKRPFIFTAKEYVGMGMFVEEINGIKNDPTKNRYWIYYVNKKSAKTGISNYIIKKGDEIEWKYEKSEF